jgi:predicted ATPase/DNA-binding NarL/FixJ family response regulator
MPEVRPTSSASSLVELTSFVGRHRERNGIRARLADARLVTLIGPGGTGKTRLAIRTAAEVRRAFPDGVWLVDLSQLPAMRAPGAEGDPRDMLASFVMGVLGLPLGEGPSTRQLTSFVADRRALLVLDNCEHLLPECAALVSPLLRACAQLRVLTTSREPFAVAGEVLYAVAPLPTPDLDGRLSLAEVARNESVALFVARAQAVAPDFRLTEVNREPVARLCHRLEGLPLAIELAAARVNALAPQQILDRLDDRFALLARGSRTAPDRHQTLQGCLDWSSDLCAAPERWLWARLSVFAGGFELDAAESICSDNPVAKDELVDLLAGLVDKSILNVTVAGRSARYRMLETIRDYGWQQLSGMGEHVTARRRHRDWVLTLVDRAGAEWVSDRQRLWYARLNREHANLRSAAEFCLTEPGEAEAAIRVVAALPPMYWWARVLTGEALRWTQTALATVTEPTALRTQALLHAGHLGIWHYDVDTVTRLVDQGHALAERLGDHVSLAFAAHTRATAANQRGDFATAADFGRSALESLAAVPESEYESALPLRLQVLFGLGAAALGAGDLDTSLRSYQEVIDITTFRGETVWRSYALLNRGLVAWRRGEVDETRTYVQECLRVARDYETGDLYGINSVEVLAWIAAREQQHQRAATLLGAADKLLTDRNLRIASYRSLAADHDDCERQVRQTLGEAEYDRSFRQGARLSVSEVFAYALDERDQPGQGSANTVVPAPLTRRERQVADLVADGLSNKEIAANLVISRRTAEGHVERILIKLNFTSRAQLAAWVAAQRADVGG